jgi:hypothetical protein
MKILDRKRAPVPQEEPVAQLPARAEREAILSRARAIITAKKPSAPVAALPVATKKTVPARQSPKRSASRAVTAKARPAVPAAIPAGQTVHVAPPAETRPGETPPSAAPGGSSQTIIVQVAAPQPAYPWWGPGWWGGYYAAPCSWRSCPRRSGLPCRRWLCD